MMFKMVHNFAHMLIIKTNTCVSHMALLQNNPSQKSGTSSVIPTLRAGIFQTIFFFFIIEQCFMTAFLYLKNKCGAYNNK